MTDGGTVPASPAAGSSESETERSTPFKNRSMLSFDIVNAHANAPFESYSHHRNRYFESI
ncbi:hypothetical protein HFX_5273 (plasmid) [Haloferax mediterranei ATCC 33500]|uniref:Uncharacterized protein n=1 Tax=Haloferax mediterranei (strain ATCC 33500 / DSM 1411 / JCM 8866 / NBRC 14739 / NCIMB 2177 / R-4) TaxID=523841 RepID=I3RA45_HALMT|nr:hypothetical protein HFX_5273 [Haloferax mediterranei ATCC 33500]